MSVFTSTKSIPDVKNSEVLNEHSPIEKRSLQDRFEVLSNRFWLLELFACFASWIIIAIIAAGLSRLNNESILYYSWSSHAPTILVFLSTVLKSTVMLPVVGSIGQLKWHHFRGNNVQDLKALEVFSDAARGLLGSLKLLKLLKLAHFACIGAVITILAFFVPTVTQQALATVNGGSSGGQTWVQRNSQYTMTTLFPREDGVLLPPSAVTNGFSFAISTDAKNQLGSFQTGLWSCTSANCSYPTYQSLGVRSQCVDLTSQISSSGSVITHPSDSSLLLFSDTAINSSTIFTAPPPGLYKDPVGLLLARWLVLGRSVGLDPTSDVIAAECAFYWAVNTYNGNVTNGYAYETVVGEFVEYTKNGTLTLPTTNGGSLTVPWNYLLRPDPCYVNGAIVSSSDTRCVFSVDGGAQEALINFLSLPGYSLPGAATVQNNGQVGRTFEYNSAFVLFMLSEFNNANAEAMFSNVAKVASQGSEMLTTQVRQQPISGNSVSTYIYDHVFGTQLFVFPVYVARWAYMAYPIGIAVLSTLFFAITSALTRNEEKWKNSFIAVLFHGLAHEQIVRHGELRSLEDMKTATEGLLVKFVDTPEGEKLMSNGTISH